jgi:hypothetical protein
MPCIPVTLYSGPRSRVKLTTFARQNLIIDRLWLVTRRRAAPQERDWAA